MYLIQELVRNLDNKDRNIQSDCIKVLYEIGYIAPELIAGYVDKFLELLRSKNNRLVWGGMIALSTIADLQADEMFAHRDEIVHAVEKGSVITQDRGIAALATIASKRPAYNEVLFPFLLKQLSECRPKDVPLRAEKILVAVNAGNKDEYITALETRMADMKPAGEKRLQKVIRQAELL